jgi:hypothetical protein
MTPRLNPFAAAPAPMKSWFDWSTGIQKGGLEDSLMELVKIRVSAVTIIQVVVGFGAGRAGQV